VKIAHLACLILLFVAPVFGQSMPLSSHPRRTTAFSPTSSQAPAVRFKPVVTYDPGGGAPNTVAVADVNGDGKPDLLVSNAGSIGVLLGNGDGTFQPALTYSTGDKNTYSALAVADVNGDGKLDVVVTNQADIGVGVLLGNGDGTFQPVVLYSAGRDSSVAVADVNGDGKPDIVVAGGNSVGVLIGNGDGTFQAVVTYSVVGYSATSVAVGDLNGDGRPDIVVANLGSSNGNRDGTADVLLGNGDGTFQSPLYYSSGGSQAFSVAIADVNGDGKPDLVLANNMTDNVGVLLGNGDGTFSAAVTYGSGGDADWVTVADMNGDGKPDLIVSNEYASNVGVLLGNGDGTFQAAVTFFPVVSNLFL